jgi:Helix-turn-helix of DDE superfamily endonuclease
MGGIQLPDIQTRTTEVLDLSSLTVGEFQRMVSPFEVAFQTHMARWRLDGQPRTARRYTTYTNCLLPTSENRLLFILVYLKTYPIQVVRGRLLGMGQSQTHQWIHVLLVVLQATLRTLQDTPTRSLTELAKRIGGAEAEAPVLVVPTTAPPTLVEPPTPAPAVPLLATMGPNGASSVPTIRRSRGAVIAARKNAARKKRAADQCRADDSLAE